VKQISILCWQNVKFEKLKLGCRRLTWPMHPVKEILVIVTYMFSWEIMNLMTELKKTLRGGDLAQIF